MSATKATRLELRSTRDQKTLLERAASLAGVSVSAFVLSSALKEAHGVIREHQVTTLTLRDWDRFIEIMERDEAPNEHLLEAMKAHQDSVTHSEGL